MQIFTDYDKVNEGVSGVKKVLKVHIGHMNLEYL